MKYAFVIITGMILSACGTETTEDPISIINQPKPEEAVFTEALMIRQIESKLEIPGTEKYRYEVYREDLNGDDSLDIIVTVNQLDKALNEAIESGEVAKRAEVGYIGNYNHFFYIDGKTKEMSPPIAVPSSPHANLSVHFDHIRSEAYKDLLIDFRIRNSCFRRFFTVVNRIPRQTFEAKIFDGLGGENPEAYVIQYDKGSYSLAKDILVYRGILESIQIKDPNEVYQLEPKITPTEKLERKWFFNDRDLKYFTEK